MHLLEKVFLVSEVLLSVEDKIFTYSKTNGLEKRVNDRMMVIALRQVVTVTQINAPYSLIKVRTMSIPK